MVIYAMFEGKLIGSYKMKKHVCYVLTLMEQDIINYITENCWFLGSMEDAWAFTLTGNDLKNQHLILLSDELLRENAEQIHYTIAHEIGHVILKHRNSILKVQDKKEIAKQEQEADDFAKKYIHA